MSIYDRKVRLAEIKSTIKNNRVGYTLFELITQAQDRYSTEDNPTRIVLNTIRYITNNPKNLISKTEVLINLLQVLTPDYYRNTFIPKYPGLPEAMSFIPVMVCLWQALGDKEAGYPLELEVAKAAEIVARMIISEGGELDICLENQKNMPDLKS